MVDAALKIAKGNPEAPVVMSNLCFGIFPLTVKIGRERGSERGTLEEGEKRMQTRKKEKESDER